MIALLIIPAAAARFWTERLGWMLAISGILGALGCLIGAGTSALLPRLPSGAMIVLTCAAFFVISMVFGSARGILVRQLRRYRLNRNIDRQHLLRAIYEMLEQEERSPIEERTSGVELAQLFPRRSWSMYRLKRCIERAERSGLLYRQNGLVHLTRSGLREAARLTKEHRLWELYLIRYADIAPNRVDRDADRIEHVLEPEIISELEALLDRRKVLVPASPHEVKGETMSDGRRWGDG